MGKIAVFKKVVTFIAVPLVIIGIMFYHVIKMKHIRNMLSNEYLIIESKDSINDIVMNIYFPDGFRDVPSTKLIKLSDGSKRTLFTYNEDDSASISDVIRAGTIISKQKDNDTVALINITSTDTSVYYFKILNSEYK
jgi:hypothetical protein